MFEAVLGAFLVPAGLGGLAGRAGALVLAGPALRRTG